jgi:hypothetical protein
MDILAVAHSSGHIVDGLEISVEMSTFAWTVPRMSHKLCAGVEQSYLRHKDPPSYYSSLPSYEDVFGDLPPEYTGADALACAKIVCKSPYVDPPLERINAMDINEPFKLDLSGVRRLQAIDLTYTGNLRESVSKKKKQEQKKAQAVRTMV